jgi:hypothetical protein
MSEPRDLLADLDALRGWATVAGDRDGERGEAMVQRAGLPVLARNLQGTIFWGSGHISNARGLLLFATIFESNAIVARGRIFLGNSPLLPV